MFSILMMILLIASAAAFIYFSYLDAKSSIGYFELNRLFKRKNGIFSPARYVLINGALGVALLLIGLVGGFPYPGIAAFLVMAYRRRGAARRNNAINR